MKRGWVIDRMRLGRLVGWLECLPIGLRIVDWVVVEVETDRRQLYIEQGTGIDKGGWKDR